MGISFWHKKKEEPQAPKAVPENGVNAVKRSDTESDAPGGVRLRRIAVGAAVILSAIVIAGPFVVSERAVKAESPAKTEIPSPPAVSQADEYRGSHPVDGDIRNGNILHDAAVDNFQRNP